jgi:phosphoglycolate phosphatase
MPGCMTLRGILFDKDGTLLDFEATWGPLYKRLALDLAEGDLRKADKLLVGGGFDPLTNRMRAGSVLGAGTTDEIVEVWFPGLSGEERRAMAARIDAVFHAHGEHNSVPVPDLVETLDALAAMGFAMGVATNDATGAAKAALNTLGLNGHLRHVFGYDSVKRPKPGPDIVHAFAQAIGAAPSEVAVVGDNLHDIEMARSAGAGLAIGVLTGNSGEAELGPVADVVLPSIRELPAWLAQRRK